MKGSKCKFEKFKNMYDIKNLQKMIFKGVFFFGGG